MLPYVHDSEIVVGLSTTKVFPESSEYKYMKIIIEQLLSSLWDGEREDGVVCPDNGSKVPTVQKDRLETADEFLGYEAFTIQYEDPLITLTYNIKS